MKYRRLVLLAGCGLTLAVAGCGTAGTTEVGGLEQELRQVRSDNAELQATVDRLRQSREGAGVQQAAFTGEAELPPGAKPGECYARVFVPGETKTTTEQVVVREASERVQVVPAEFGWEEQQVLVKEASERVEVIPPKYGWAEERVLVKEASEKLVTVPAVYDTVQEKILVRPAYTTWKKGRGPIEKIDEATGEIMCLVNVPAEYRTVTKRVLKTPETTKTVTIPAEYRTVKKRVVVEPAKTRTATVPAEYQTVRVNKMIKPASETRVVIPAEYGTITKQEKISGGRMEWRPILCETNATRGVISDLQRTLASKGYQTGPIDGVLGQRTMSAVRSYQRDKGLVTGQLTIETLKALDVSLTQ